MRSELQFQGIFFEKTTIDQQNNKIKLSFIYLTEPGISDSSSIPRKIFWIIQEMEKIDC